MACNDCVKLSNIDPSSTACKKTKPRIVELLLACCDELTETISASVDSICTNGYISDLVSLDPIGNPTPLVSVAIYNKDEAEETNDFTYDRATEIGTDTYAAVFLVKVLNPGNQCMLDSLKGREVCLYYRVEGLDGDYIWRRLKGTLTAVTGGLLAGYQLTFDQVDPADEDKPMWMNFGTAAATTAALYALLA